MLNGTEKWWQSRSVWGSVVAFVALVVSFFGLTVAPEDQEMLVGGIVAVVGAVGAAIGVWGRVRATKRIE